MSAPDDTESGFKDYLESLPKGTVIQVTSPSGSRFWLEAEGRIWHDFILHKGDAPHGLEGRASNFGLERRYWSTKALARWVAEGLCRIELASPPVKGADQ